MANLVSKPIASTRLDFCNALLAGISEKNLYKLQLVQNKLARVVIRSRRQDHTKLLDVHSIILPPELGTDYQIILEL